MKNSNWDKEMCGRLMSNGLTREQSMFVVGIIAEERQIADRQGYERGYNKICKVQDELDCNTISVN